MPKKVFRLDDDDEDEIPKPVLLIGIAGTIKYYKLCHYLNKTWELDFEMQESIKLRLPCKQNTFEFIHLKAVKNPGEVSYEVLTNKDKNESLIPEASDYDLLLKIDANLPPQEVKKICSQLKQMPEVMIAVPIETNSIKTLERIFTKE